MGQQWLLLLVWALAMLAGCERPRSLFVPSDSTWDASSVTFATGQRARDMDAAVLPPPPEIAANCGTLRCAEGARCVERCAPAVDPCNGVQCDQGSQCFEGRCEPSCCTGRCGGVVCPAGQYCNPPTGECVQFSPCNSPCAAGKICVLVCSRASPCDNVRCEPGFRCVNGMCEFDNCTLVHCPDDMYCDDGQCVETLCGPSSDPVCRANARCGERGNDGRWCVGRCPPGLICDGGACRCLRYCASDALCGSPDGCDGTCDRNCSDVSDASVDATVDSPPADEGPVRRDATPDVAIGRLPDARQPIDVLTCMVSCRSGVCGENDGCNGTCAGSCPPGEFCANSQGRFSCACMGHCPANPACGAVDGCGRFCFGSCPGNEICAGSAGGYRCICRPSCPANAVCSQPDGCGRTCPGACPDGSRCVAEGFNNWVCGCQPYCPPNAWCGQPNGCGGLCAGACAYGSSCDPSNYRCRCVASCAPGGPCGAPDGCGGTCPGACAAGELCNPAHACIRRQAGCVLSRECPCGWPCEGGRCRANCPIGSAACGCGSCCNEEQVCIRGVCQIAPP